MKTKVTLSLALILFSINILAGDNLVKTTNISYSKVEEVVFYEKHTDKPIRKSVNQLNPNDQVEMKTVYIWDKYDGWKPNYKLNFTYSTSDSRTPTSVTRTKWNLHLKDWDSINSKTRKTSK